MQPDRLDRDRLRALPDERDQRPPRPTAPLDSPDVPESLLAGLLRPWSPPARAYLSALAHGWPHTRALRAAGVYVSTVDAWQRDDPEFAAAVTEARALGDGRLEGELYARALAGPDDRGSARLLEVAVKARLPHYRDKQGSTINVMVDARERRERLASGWRDVTPQDD